MFQCKGKHNHNDHINQARNFKVMNIFPFSFGKITTFAEIFKFYSPQLKNPGSKL